MAAGEVIDLAPIIRRRQQSSCAHESFDVGMTEAIVVCRACGAPLDPWWVLRSIVERREQQEEEEAARKQAAEATLLAWLQSAQAEATRISQDIARLHHERNRLLADPVLAGRRRGYRGAR